MASPIYSKIMDGHDLGMDMILEWTWNGHDLDMILDGHDLGSQWFPRFFLVL